ncbi:MAG: imidazoleglycerol-phosphate dehydratase HisB [Eubacteriales bacterium]|nr:imidazoleglycerol-phosphate dehydratase HisB [Eubacteriales bacterium]
MRSAQQNRQTKETDIQVSLDIDGQGNSEIQTGVGFLDHMLTLLAKHAQFNLNVHAVGDLQIDAHHTVEDVGIVIGQTLARALGDKRGINRYGQALIPMDEALLEAVVDCSGRPFFVYNVALQAPQVGDFETQLAEEFFRALAFNAGLTLHLSCRYGKNDHHIIEGLFKALARALAVAVRIDTRRQNQIPSTKGVL